MIILSLLGVTKCSETEAASFLVFDILIDTMYSEVATLIKENEIRPHLGSELA